MSTIFLGFERSIGSLTSDKTGEVINYSNRYLKFATDDGNTDKTFGYSYFEFKKVKMSVLAESFGVKEDDEAVDTVLKSLKLKPVEVVIAPRNNELTCVGIRLIK